MTELQAMLAASSGELLDAEVTPEVLDAADRGAWPERLWRSLDEAEYPRLFAAGDDVGWDDARPIVEAAGAALAPVPLPESLLASWLAARVGLALPSGIVTVVPQRSSEPWRANERGGTWYVSGSAAGVPWGARAAHALVAVDAAGEPLLAALATTGLRIDAGTNAAHEPRDDVRADEAPAVAIAPLGTLPPDVVRRFGALVRAAQMAGALRRVLRVASTYAGEREQFGRPIAQFQAVSQQLAVLAEERTAAGIAVAYAWREASEDPASPAVAVAKVRTGQAAGVAAAIAHAICGAIGSTHEHALHFATRRLWSWRAEFGAEHEWARELGAAVIAQGGAQLWSTVTSPARRA